MRISISQNAFDFLGLRPTFRSYTQAGGFTPELPMKRCISIYYFPVHEARNPACG
jgi:hypothetical protein